MKTYTVSQDSLVELLVPEGVKGVLDHISHLRLLWVVHIHHTVGVNSTWKMRGKKNEMKDIGENETKEI